MTYADTQEAYRDARRMERYSCIGPDEQDREQADERREIQQERMIERAREMAYETKEPKSWMTAD